MDTTVAWRQCRRLSQLNLAVDAEISARHLSLLETGRSQPSREMILRRQIDLTADAALVDLQRELLSYPGPREVIEDRVDQAMIPFQIHVDGRLLSLFSTTMIFGTPADITLSEFALEFFFPANAQTAVSVRDFSVLLSSQPLALRCFELGYRSAVLWVLAGNVRAVGFYESRGWGEDGTSRQAEVWGIAVTEIRFARLLDLGATRRLRRTAAF